MGPERALPASTGLSDRLPRRLGFVEGRVDGRYRRAKPAGGAGRVAAIRRSAKLEDALEANRGSTSPPVGLRQVMIGDILSYVKGQTRSSCQMA